MTTDVSPHAPARRAEPLNATQLIVADLPPRETILDPILSKKSLMMLYGPRGLGKTYVALGIAWAAASGATFLKWQASRPHKVLYIDGEMAAVDLKERLRQFGSAPRTLDFLIADLEPIRGLPDLGYFDGQKALIESWGIRPDLLVLDNLASLVGFRGNDPDTWTQVQRWLMSMRRLGMAVLIVHHSNKDGEQRGTSRREDVLDVVVSLRRPYDYVPRDGARFELHFDKARGLMGDAVDPIEARLATDDLGIMRWDWRALSVGEFERAVGMLRQGLGPMDVARELKISKSRAYRMRERAREMGLLENGC